SMVTNALGRPLAVSSTAGSFLHTALSSFQLRTHSSHTPVVQFDFFNRKSSIVNRQQQNWLIHLLFSCSLKLVACSFFRMLAVLLSLQKGKVGIVFTHTH